jgi:hypothetical protein
MRESRLEMTNRVSTLHCTIYHRWDGFACLKRCKISKLEHNHTDTCLAWSGDPTNTPQIHSHGIWCDVGRRILTETAICHCGKCVFTQQVSSPRRPASHPPRFRPCEIFAMCFCLQLNWASNLTHTMLLYCFIHFRFLKGYHTHTYIDSHCRKYLMHLVLLYINKLMASFEFLHVPFCFQRINLTYNATVLLNPFQVSQRNDMIEDIGIVDCCFILVECFCQKNRWRDGCTAFDALLILMQSQWHKTAVKDQTC